MSAAPRFRLDILLTGAFIPLETVSWESLEAAMFRLSQIRIVGQRYRIRRGICPELARMRGEVVWESL